MFGMKKYYWVLGNHVKGFRIVDKMPKGRIIPEPFDSLEAAKRWVAMEYLLNS